MSSYLLSLETATPTYLHRHSDFVDFYYNSLDEDDEKIFRKINVIAKKSGIQQRYSVIKDFSANPNDFQFFAPNAQLEPMPGLAKRMELYREEALKLSLDAVNKIHNIEAIKERLTHIITVTCTGLFAPGLEIELIRHMGLDSTINRSSINFMGCNAAVLALKQADQICKGDRDALVLIVCTELCSIHFQKDFSDDYILSNLLFGDGSAAAIIGGQIQEIDPAFHPLEIGTFHSLIIHEGANDMAWQITEKGFIMNLSSYVSALLNNKMHNLFIQSGIHPSTIDYWAIHPGGKKIIDDFRSLLSLEKEKLSSSYEVLQQFGNMSSPTVLFVLQHLVSNQPVKRKETIFLAAFGPGLSIESTVMSYV